MSVVPLHPSSCPAGGSPVLFEFYACADHIASATHPDDLMFMIARTGTVLSFQALKRAGELCPENAPSLSEDFMALLTKKSFDLHDGRGRGLAQRMVAGILVNRPDLCDAVELARDAQAARTAREIASMPATYDHQRWFIALYKKLADQSAAAIADALRQGRTAENAHRPADAAQMARQARRAAP